ncbi:MAG: N-acetylmuramoyl-L-alanine amidase [Candidatus Acidiferrum sp.]
MIWGRNVFHMSFARVSLGFALLAICVLPCLTRAATANNSMKREAASAQFARAEEMRAVLNAKPWDKRTLADYKKVSVCYQRVYLITPRAMEVPDALLAVAELNTEMGDRFGRSYYEAAAEAYQFLIREYPTSKYVQDAQLRMAKLQKDQLGDPIAATKTYQDFQKNYPRSPRKREVQEALAELALQRNTESGDATTKNGGTAPAASNVAAPRTESVAVDSKATISGGEDTNTGAVPRVQRIRTNVTPDSTEIIIELEDSVQYVSGRIANPDRIYFDLYAARLSPSVARENIKVSGTLLTAVRAAQNKAGIVRVVMDVTDVKDYAATLMKKPSRLLIELYSTSPKTDGVQTAHSNRSGRQPLKPSPTESAIAVASAVTDPAPEEIADSPASQPSARVSAEVSPATTSSGPASAPATTAAAYVPKSITPAPKADLPSAKVSRSKSSNSASTVKADNTQPAVTPQPTRDGQSTLTRALGLKIGRIVIDAGHGGHDTGTIGPTGLMEKDLCLDVALRLGKMLQQKLPGAEIVYTRSDDTFIPLEDRTRIANDAKADLFVSIHANSSPDHAARGVETYYLNMRGSADSMEVAARENAVSQQGIHDLEDIVKKIARTEKIDESKELAEDIQDSLSKRIQKTAKPVKNRGVRKAPFVVLIGADMPSILTEISFLSNPADEQLLKKPEHRQRVAEGLYQGVADYLQSLNSMAVNGTSRPSRPTIVPAVESSRNQK